MIASLLIKWEVNNEYCCIMWLMIDIDLSCDWIISVPLTHKLLLVTVTGAM